jgi:RimJ/RimL family protein N-acetyltransferase
MRTAWDIPNEVSAWTAKRIPHARGRIGNFYFAVGVVSEEGKAIAGIVFSDYYPDYGTIQVSVAAETPRWATRGIVAEILSYPFFQLGAQKVWSAMPHDNTRAIRFNKGIGFKQEGILARQFGDKHAVITRMFAEDYRRIYGAKTHGEKFSSTARCA